MEAALKHIKIQENDQIILDSNNESILLPGLPNHLAHLCLSKIHPSLLYSVCKSWRRLIYTPYFPPFYCLYAICSQITSPMVANTTSKCSKVHLSSVEFFCFDPISYQWSPLPNPPSNPPLRVLRNHPSFISRTLSIQSLTVSERMVLIAATANKFLPALEHPLGFDPLSNEWFSGPPLPTPRRWCGTSSVQGNVYVASGIGSAYRVDVARSLEKWDVKQNKANEWKWERMAALKDGRFSRETVDAIGYRGKLCMVNVKGHAVKQGAVYDMKTDEWEEMPEGMLVGWNGPAAATVNDESEMYVVDETKGSLSRYVSEVDQWEKLIESCDYLKGAEQITAGRGRVCAICSGGRQIVVVDVTVKPAYLVRVVNAPPNMEAIALHILPRINVSD